MFPIPNEYVLLAGVSVLLVLIGWEYHDTQLLLSFGGKPSTAIKRAASNTDVGSTAAISGEPVVSEAEPEKSEGGSVDAVSANQLSTILDDNSVVSEEISTEPHRQSRYTERISVSESITNIVMKAESSKEAIEEIVKKIIFPLPPGCEPFGPNANYIAEKIPQLSRPDIVRFLVARKGNVQMATEMAEKCLEWRASVFPLKKDDLRAAINTGCFFPYRTARDGTPVVYMRGGLYDNVKATPEQFVLAAAYAIEYSLRTHPKQINVTVVVDTVIIPGAPNLGADMTFIKLFVKVSSTIFFQNSHYMRVECCRYIQTAFHKGFVLFASHFRLC